MDRGIPVSNKFLSCLWTAQSQYQHILKLRQVKPTINMKSMEPKKYAHLQKRRKKEQLAEDRCTEIERENRILLEKMSQIMKGNCSYSGIAKIPRGKSSSDLPRRKSLNKEKRKKDLIRITMENHALLKRLQSRQSLYKKSSMDAEEEQREKLVESMCEYPYAFAKSRQANRRPGSSNKFSTFYSSPFVQPSRVSNSSFDLGRNRQMNRPSAIRDLKLKKTVMHKTRKVLGGALHAIEISVSYSGLTISAQNMNDFTSFTVEIPLEKWKELLGTFGNNYKLLASCLDIKDNNLIVKNPSKMNKSECNDENVFL